MNLDLDAGDVAAAYFKTDRVAVEIAGRAGISAEETRRSGGGLVDSRRQTGDAKSAIGIGDATDDPSDCDSARRPPAAHGDDVDRQVGRRLTAVGVNHAACDGIGFQWRAEVNVYALGAEVGFDVDRLSLFLFDHVRVISLWIANAPAHARPVAPARADQIASRRQTVDSINAAVVGFIT